MRRKWELSSFGKKVKKYLMERNMTHRELAAKVGISPCYLSAILGGIAGTDELFKRIADELGIKKY